MKDIIVIGDIHGSDLWKDIVEAHKDCMFVFLGDYLDPYQSVSSSYLISNLKEIVALKKSRMDDVVLLLGNHDIHYFIDGAPMSSRFDYRLTVAADEVFANNSDLFQNAYQAGNKLFTHAGVSHRWFVEDFKGDLDRPVADQLNHPHDSQIPAMLQVGENRGGSKGKRGGIFWADKNELTDPLHGYTQIVGHNRVDEVTELKYENGNSIVFCDCLRNGLYFCVDS